jgi:tRNA (cytidine/uridine-2'-O-)-methyltransferase
MTSDERKGLPPHLATRDRPLAHVVLYQPEIPQNAGNIGRTCVAVGAKLWIVRPAAFRLDDHHLRRAGLDYWEHLQWEVVDHWDQLIARLQAASTPPNQATTTEYPTTADHPTGSNGGLTPNWWYFSRHAHRPLWEAPLAKGDIFVFGNESSGLPPSLLDPQSAKSIRLPTTDRVRSLNLATTAGIVLYDLVRRQHIP